MLDDLEAGRACEIDYLQGEIVSRAEKVGLTAPKNAVILAAVQTAFSKGRSPELSGAALFNLIKE